MHKIKTLTALLLLLSMMLSFTACDGKDSGSDKKSLSRQLKNAEVGDYITFGTYEQDNDTGNGAEEIEWLVLEVKDDRILVISKYALDALPYHEDWEEITWEKCSLRRWLNSEFIEEAFSSKEEDLIVEVKVSADGNPDYSTKSGNDTRDRVFLLSIEEAEEYFRNNEERECRPTKYAVANGSNIYNTNNNSWWWLRSPGNIQFSAASIDNEGNIITQGNSVNYSVISVRPALWIDLDS